ncbi:long-chain-acyl-CoA synthetase [Halopseudomonas maritima]|uniref:long-chain-acyl-CoA synthetase n=1 Tax=Halopseudomonas maritima TaxID=2918528 RepID=UPI001EEAC604|nr:long-chain-acyl-CoA synthetase [Halopseudomonas maritima]UJJ31565.1 long-chain-acyl-CoA synthetase [Halopseudomonas maritima]
MSSQATATQPHDAAVELPSREATQAKLDQRSVAAGQIKPADHYTLADRIEAQVDRYPERPFLVYGEQRFSYAEADAEINRYANEMHARGLRAGDVCALAMENRPDFFFCWFGMAKLGVTTAFINYHLTGKPLLHAVESTNAKAVVIGEECLKVFAETPETAAHACWLVQDSEKPHGQPLPAHLDSSFGPAVKAAVSSRPPRSLRAELKAEDDMLYIFTSGTTGLPKAARYSYMRWMTSGDVMKVTLQTTPEDAFYCCLPLYHGAAATSITSTALVSGSAIVFRRKFSASEFWGDIRRYQVTVFQYIGEICRYLLNKPEQPNDREHSLRCMLGAGLSRDVWQRWVARFGELDIFEGWGATEANAATLNVDNRVGSCGRVPFWDKTNLRLLKFDTETQTHVRDEQGRYVHCQPGEIGEAVGFIVNHPEIGAGRFEGYTSAEATEKKILRNVFAEGDAWWSSGDLLRYDEDGYCYFVDRIGDTFRWKSENVSTLEVADALGDFPGMELINIYGVLVPHHEGRAGMAAVLMQPGQSFDPDAFHRFAVERVPHYAVPMFVRVSAMADMTSTFKLRKVDLQRQGYSPALVSDPLYVRDSQSGSYQLLNDEVLARNGLPAYQGDVA